MSLTWEDALRSFGKDFTRGALQLLYPAACFACNRPLRAEQHDFCEDCRLALITDPFPSCPRCASTVGPFTAITDGCPSCRMHGLHFDRALRLGPYDRLLREVVLRMKYVPGEPLAEKLGELWATASDARLRELGCEVVVPVPLHWWRRWERGYNQSETLAWALAQSLGLPCQQGWLRRTRNTPKQTDQTPAGRRENVKRAFAARIRRELRGKAVLLVDDVLTTGSTASEAARALREAGAARVAVAVLAHGHGAGMPTRVGTV